VRIVQWYRRAGTTQGEILTDVFGCWGLAMDDQRYLYVSDDDKYEVRRYQLGGDMEDDTVVASWKRLNGGSDLCHMFVDRQQTVYVTEDSYGVMKWDKGVKKGTMIAEIGNNTRRLQWDGPGGLFVDTSGTLYVVDRSNGSIIRWPQGASQGTVILGGNGQLHFSSDLGYDSRGNLYFVGNNYSIQRFSIQ
jgi:sugar lactone lactonase YvrE